MKSSPMTARRSGMAAAALAVLFSVSVEGQEKDVPSDDFLEYLAALVEEEGEWVDPLELDELPDEHLDQDLKSAGDKPFDDAQRAEEKP